MDMKKLIPVIFSLMCLMLMSAVIPVRAYADGYYYADAKKGEKTSNADIYSYTWADPIDSYLYESGGYLYRLENTDGKIILEKYDSSFRYKGKGTIKSELPLFGGFYAGKDYNYILFGQENTGDSDSREVVRVVKYTKGMKRLDSVSFYGMNTHIPFEAGCPRMTENADGSMLLIEACHTMYTSSDGYNHQANMSLFIRTSDMKATRTQYNVASPEYAEYVSHSFDQYILERYGYVFTVHHGDAYNRGINLFMISGYSGGSDIAYLLALRIKGDTGDNYTGLSLGGAEMNDENVLIAGNTVSQDSGWAKHDQRNVFVLRVPLDGTGTQAPAYFTKYADGSGISISKPKLVKISDSSFMLLWNETKDSKTKLYIAMLDEYGRKKGSIHAFADVKLSECQPIVYNDQVVFYTTDNSAPRFYFFNKDGNFSAQKKNRKK
ncbi:MAG: hypothetical protein II664_00730 [Oscillospiraceae bacterium]|nr:hypothetical protein [Oscillospiraceae bacterium]